VNFESGLGRPWGRVAEYNWESKYKSIRWSKFGGERLLAAANSDERERVGKSQKPHPENRRMRQPAGLSKLKPPKDDEFGSRGREADYFSKLRGLLAKMKPHDQQFLLHMAQKAARGSNRSAD
jgi:hypothetical protein